MIKASVILETAAIETSFKLTIIKHKHRSLVEPIPHEFEHCSG